MRRLPRIICLIVPFVLIQLIMPPNEDYRLSAGLIIGYLLGILAYCLADAWDNWRAAHE
jgi:hypothetical protein